MDDKPLCRHCHAKPVNRPRGLCWTCYYAPGIRQLCRSHVDEFWHGIADRDDAPPRDSEPTDALPGTAEKEAVLTRRASQGLDLWHPRDATGHKYRHKGGTCPEPGQLRHLRGLRRLLIERPEQSNSLAF